MSPQELEEIIENGLGQLHLASNPEAIGRIAQLSEGLPYYTHLLALHAAQHAIADDRSNITSDDVSAAIELAVQKVQHSIRRAYQEAIRSPQRKNLLAQVLLACALSPKDEFGFFTAASVSEPMTVIMSKPYDIPAYSRHLSQFSSDVRGYVLTKRGDPRKIIYRFEDPLLQPFVILDGLSRGLITEEKVVRLQGQRQPEVAFDPTELELPFERPPDDTQG